MTGMPPPTTRHSTRTVKNRRVSFNQVILINAPQPDRVVLLGWDPAEGVYAWDLDYALVAANARPQHGKDYSRYIPDFSLDSPPAWMGPPELIPKAALEQAGAWMDMSGLAPHPKRQAILNAVRAVRPDLVP